jgi:hypothetical protein
VREDTAEYIHKLELSPYKGGRLKQRILINCNEIIFRASVTTKSNKAAAWDSMFN